MRELEARGWTQKDLAEITNRPIQTINEIIQAKKQITPETALDLAAAFGTSAELWINLETN
jgi:HTH-type transcriptional regulator/antitoxin HigA